MSPRGLRMTAAALALAVAAGVSGCATVSDHASKAAPAASSTSTPSAKGNTEGYAGGIQDPTLTEKPASAQGVVVTGVSIPSIGVNAPTEMLHRDATGALLPPVAWQSAGWYQEGVVPGQVGPAVIAGHIDSAIGPAVFARLNQLQPGAAVAVSLSNGQTVNFTVTGSIDVSKQAFPTDQVYGNTPDAQLRLISCTGTFNKAIGHYDSNLVVFATLAS